MQLKNDNLDPTDFHCVEKIYSKYERVSECWNLFSFFYYAFKY